MALDDGPAVEVSMKCARLGTLLAALAAAGAVGLAQAPAASPPAAGGWQERDFLSRIRRLTVEGRRAGEGYWAPDGKRLVFQSEREPGNPFYQIYLLDLGTGDTGTEWWTYGYSPFLQSFGGDLIDRNTYTTASGVLNGGQAIAWANWFQGLVKNKYAPAKSGTDAFADFVNGKSAMVWSGIWNAGNISKVKDGVIMPPPDLGAGPKIGGGSWQWAISSGCANAAGALDYIKFSMQPKYLAAFATKQNVIPATEEAAAMTPGWEEGGNKRFFLDESKKFALIRPPTPAYPFITTTYAKAAQDIIAGGDAKQILDQAASDIDQNLKSNNNYGA